LAQEIQAELARLDKTTEEAASAIREGDEPALSHLELYGAAALLHSFYNGVEKALTWIGHSFGLSWRTSPSSGRRFEKT
jgi:hypothetical protein